MEQNFIKSERPLLNLVKVTDPVLRMQCSSLTDEERQSKKIHSFVDAMADFVSRRCYKGNKARLGRVRYSGMAANQFGLLKRIIAVDLAIGSLDYQDVHVLINPEIIWHSENQILGSEGCKSIPYVYGFVKRYEEVHVKAFDRSGNILQICSNGRPAALLQHEIDHLNGRLFIDYLEDPTMAFFVKNKDIDKYRENPALWAEFISVAKLVKSDQ